MAFELHILYIFEYLLFSFSWRFVCLVEKIADLSNLIALIKTLQFDIIFACK